MVASEAGRYTAPCVAVGLDPGAQRFSNLNRADHFGVVDPAALDPIHKAGISPLLSLLAEVRTWIRKPGHHVSPAFNEVRVQRPSSL